MLNEIIEMMEKGSRAAKVQLVLSQENMEIQERRLDPKKTAEQLLEVFEHINFFNLFETEPTQKDLANKDAIEALYWQIQDEK